MISGASQFQRQGASPGGCLRLDVEDLAGAPIVAHEAAVLPLGVDDHRVLGIDAGLKPSPKTVTNQSSLVMPAGLRVRDGPPRVALSWVPP